VGPAPAEKTAVGPIQTKTAAKRLGTVNSSLAQKVMSLRQDLDMLKVWVDDLKDQTEIFEVHVVGYGYECEELMD
jgi:hypothetical protein